MEKSATASKSMTESRSEKMSVLSTKLIVTGVLFVFTLISGVIVTRSGRPLSLGLVTLHKSLSIGTVIFVGIVVNQLYKTLEGKVFVQLSAMVITGLLFLALIGTGALLTREEMQLPAIVFKLHQVLPLLSLVSSAGTIFLLL